MSIHPSIHLCKTPYEGCERAAPSHLYLLARRWGVEGGLQPHLVGDDWLGLDLLHSDGLAEERALVQGELLVGVGVQGRADLEGGGRRGTNAGQHLRLAERLRECVAGGVSRVALQLGQGEGPGPQVGRRRLGGRWHAVEGRVGWHHVGGGLAGLGTLDLRRVAVRLREETHF